VLGHVFGPVPFEREDVAVYRYGREANFCAIVTTLDDFSMFGIGWTDEEEPRPRIEFAMAELCDSEAYYNRRIVFENNFRNAAFLTPSAHYSPISNLPVIKHKGIILEDTDQFLEMEAYGDEGEGWDDDEEAYGSGAEIEGDDDSGEDDQADAEEEDEQDETDAQASNPPPKRHRQNKIIGASSSTATTSGSSVVTTVTRLTTQPQPSSSVEVDAEARPTLIGDGGDIIDYDVLEKAQEKTVVTEKPVEKTSEKQLRKKKNRKDSPKPDDDTGRNLGEGDGTFS